VLPGELDAKVAQFRNWHLQGEGGGLDWSTVLWHLKIKTPESSNYVTSFDRRFYTHPTTEERIMQLQALAQQVKEPTMAQG
jgi:Zn-dependent protease with chaperone function